MGCVEPVMDITPTVDFLWICYCYRTEREIKPWPKNRVFSMWRLEFVCSGSGTIEKELANWGLYIIGEGVALALGQGATVIREEVCVCVYMCVLMCLFSGGLSLHWPHCSNSRCRQSLSQHIRPRCSDDGDNGNRRPSAAKCFSPSAKTAEELLQQPVHSSIHPSISARQRETFTWTESRLSRM